MTGIRGGALLAETLHLLGIRDVFTLHGGHLDPFLVACPGVGIRLVDVRHEASAGHAAEAYAMLRPGMAGVCVVTAGPGFTNILTAMASAFANAVPTLFIVGGPPASEEATNELQGGINQVAMAMPVTKWAHRVSTVARLPDLVEKAYRMALSGRPGPVLLEVPINIMFAAADRVTLPVAADRPAPTKPSVSAEDADLLLDALQGAVRPIIIAGSGAILSDAGQALQSFAEVTGTAVVTNGKAHGLLPQDHPLYCGPAGTLAGISAQGFERPDLVLLVGARAGLLLGGRSGSIIPRDATVLQIDIEGSEIGRLNPVHVGLVADCAKALCVLADRARLRKWKVASTWVKQLSDVRNAGRQQAFPDKGPTGRIHPYHAARVVFEAMPAGSAVAIDGGEMTAWCEPFNQAFAEARYLTAGYFGALGVGQGFAMAAAVAWPRRPAFLLTGDGAVGFNLQEFDTMVRHGLQVVTIVMNNACWAMSKNAQDLVFGADRRTAVMLGATRYDQVAVALGCHGEQVTEVEGIAPAIHRAIASGLPACINIETDPEVMHPITFGMAGADPSKGKISMPYYQN